MQKKKLNVCFVTEDFYPDFIGGQGIYGYHLLTKLLKKDIDLTVIAEKRQGRKEYWQKYNKKLSLLLTPYCFGNQLLLALFEYLLFIVRYRKKYFDIVHANQLSGLLFVLFKPHNVRTVLISVHNTYQEMSLITESRLKKISYYPLIRLEKMLYERADALLFNTAAEKEVLQSYCTIVGKKTAVIHFGATPVRFSEKERLAAKIKVKKELKLSDDEKIVLYVGRLVNRKKVDTLIKALKLLHVEKVKVSGIIIGKGKEEEKLKKIVSRNVHFLGFAPDLAPYYLAADCFVTVSLAEGGVILTALEAASFGLPLILSPSAAGFPIVRDGVNGFVVDPDDVNNLVKKIKIALDNSERMGKDSLEYARSLTWEKCAKETLKFYQQVVQRPFGIP